MYQVTPAGSYYFSAGALFGAYGVTGPTIPYPFTVQTPTAVATAGQTRLSGYAQLAAALGTFQSTVQGLETPQAVSPVQASSGTPGIVSTDVTPTAATGTYNVSVNQLAQAQVLQSSAFADPAATVIGSGTLTLQTGSYDAAGNTFTATAPAVSITISNGTLDSIASAINGANAGVSASVIKDSAGYHLVLAAATTGTANGLQITTQDSDGNNTDLNGLSQLAFDPTAATGSGRNLTQTQAPANASFTINGISGTSATNNGISAAPGLTLDFLQTGSTTVTAAQSAASAQDAAQRLVNAYNGLVSTVDRLAAPGGALAGDGVAGQLLTALGNAATGGYATGSSIASSPQAGITPANGGTLRLDATTLQSAFSADPAGTTGVLNQLAQGLDNVAQQYGAPGGILASLSQSLQNQDTYQSLAFGISGGATASLDNTQSLGLQEYALSAQFNTAFANPVPGMGVLPGAFPVTPYGSLYASLYGAIYGYGSTTTPGTAISTYA